MKIVAFLFLFTFTTLFSQEKYEYVIVPYSFDFFKEPNKFNLNGLTKSFFEKEGFKVLYDTDIKPDFIANNPCEVLYANVIDDNKLFSTNLFVQVKDCKGNLLIESVKGSSREKDFDKSFTIALRQALNSLKGQLNFNKSKSFVKNENKALLTAKSAEREIVVDNNNSVTYTSIITETGYQIINSEKEVVFDLTKTSSDDIFIARKGNLNGVLVKKINGWFFEYNEANQLVSEKVEVKF
jgi:hypothetical protein